MPGSGRSRRDVLVVREPPKVPGKGPFGGPFFGPGGDLQKGDPGTTLCPHMKKTLSLLIALTASLAMAQNANAQLKVGDNAPATGGLTDAGQKISFTDVYAKQPYTLVYFYPKADTPGCTAQGCSLRDGYEALTQKGVAVIGVSHDDVAAQKAFKDKYHLPFTLVADTDDTVMNAFGVPTNPVGMAHRSAYLIKGGKIVYTDYKGTTKTQAQAILDVLAASGG
jgi:peroxiredoxin Q/BCP